MFQKLLALQGAPHSRFAKFCPSFYNFILSSYYAEKFQKHLHKKFYMSFVSSQGGTSKEKMILPVDQNARASPRHKRKEVF